MTEQRLKLTHKEVEKLINNRLDTERFEEVFNDIPMYHPEHVMQKGETHRSYIEDDQREYRWYIFKDTVTGVEHCINYTYHPEWPNDLMDTPESIEIVANDEDSDIYVKPIPVPAPVLTPFQKTIEDLFAPYKAIESECRIVIPKEKLNVPKAKIDEVLALLKGSYLLPDLLKLVIPICIEYRIEEKSFWQWLQVKRKAWKA